MTKRAIPLTVIFLIAALSANGYAATADKPINIRVSMAGGYDNNTGLDAERAADGFAQETISLYHKRLLDQKAQMRLSYNALNVNYFEATDQNIFSNELGGGINLLLTKDTMWENDYTFQYLEFPYNSAVSSFNNEMRTGLKHRLTSRLLAKAGVSVSQRDYIERKKRDGAGAYQADERSDSRFGADASLSYKWLENVILNGGTNLYWNDSNDGFHDFYDFESYKFYIGCSWQASPKLLATSKFSYERRLYGTRPLVDAIDDTQADHAYVASLSLYYQLTGQLTAGSVYTYRQKVSNEPSQQYSGSIGTLGLYYSF